MRRMKYKQLVRGNPGDCYIACLLYVLNKKYEISTGISVQKDIFIKGILSSKYSFFGGTLNEIAKRYNYPLNVYLSHKQSVYSARKDILDKKIRITYNELNPTFVEKLLIDKVFVTLSVDRFVFYPYYHDYFFCTISKDNTNFKVLEPYSGNIKSIDRQNFSEYVYSTRRGLGDVTIVITV